MNGMPGFLGARVLRASVDKGLTGGRHPLLHRRRARAMMMMADVMRVMIELKRVAHFGLQPAAGG
jgi:hypothetical protein